MTAVQLCPKGVGIVLCMASFLSVPAGNAQDGPLLDLGPDTVLCPGMPMSFSAGNGFLVQEWEDGSTEQAHLIRRPTQVRCTAVEVVRAGELLTNGDFEAGDIGFNTDLHAGVVGGYGELSEEGTYAVGPMPSNVHYMFLAQGDHTSGHGNMLVMNGDTLVGNVWCGKGRPVAATEYVFSFWYLSMGLYNAPEFGVSVNGIQQDLTFRPTKAGQWCVAHLFWNSGTEENVQFCIYNNNVQQGGNDFALDDVSLAPYLLHHDTVEVGLPEWCPDDGSACGCQIMIPSAFTPNGDGLNDGFLPRHDCPLRTWSLQVVDHWGRTIFTSTDPNMGWDGTHPTTGGPVPAGLYGWVLSTRSDAVDFPMPCERTGHVMVIR